MNSRIKPLNNISCSLLNEIGGVVVDCVDEASRNLFVTKAGHYLTTTLSRDIPKYPSVDFGRISNNYDYTQVVDYINKLGVINEQQD